MGRKPGVSEPTDLAAFVAKAGSSIIVVDARNTGAQKGVAYRSRPAPTGSSQDTLGTPIHEGSQDEHRRLAGSSALRTVADFSLEPGDEATNAKAPIGGGDVREQTACPKPCDQAWSARAP